jgi:phosphatidylglycerophosphate synthase
VTSEVQEREEKRRRDAMNVVFVAGEGDPAWEIAGLSVAERTRRAFDAARVRFLGRPEAPLLAVSRDALLEPGAIRALAAAPPGVVAAVEGDDAPAALRLPHGTPIPDDAAGLAEVLGRARAQGRLVRVSAGAARCRRIRLRGDAAQVQREMLEGLIQPTDGFFARHFDRHLSIRCSLWFVRHGVSPNAITLGATAVGLAGAGLLASGALPWQVLGALLFIASTVLDGSDGEVARLAFRQSEFGRRLDLTCDNVVNVAVFGAIGWAALAADPGGAMGIAVAAAIGGVVLASAAGFWYSAWLEREHRDAQALNAYESLASRDWAYLVLALALFGKLPWLIWAAALGSNAVAVLLVVLRLRSWPPAVEAEATAEAEAPGGATTVPRQRPAP